MQQTAILFSPSVSLNTLCLPTITQSAQSTDSILRSFYIHLIFGCSENASKGTN